MPHILVVDDDLMTTEPLTFLLTDEGYNVTVITSAKEALVAVERNVYDLIVLDVILPEMDGIEVCHRVRTISKVPIIFLSARAETKDKVMGLRAGGDDYISKPFDPDEVLARIWAALRRSGHMATSASSLQTADLVLDPVNNTVILVRINKTVRLTPIETRLLRCLMSNAGRSLTRDTLVVKVWGYENDGASNQLDMCIKRLRGKIEGNPSQPTLLLTIRDVGYKYQPSAK